MLDNPVVASFLLLSILMILIACLRLQYRQAGEILLTVSNFKLQRFFINRIGYDFNYLRHTSK